MRATVNEQRTIEFPRTAPGDGAGRSIDAQRGLHPRRFVRILAAVLTVTLAGASAARGSGGETPVERDYVTAPPAPIEQSREQADAKSAGCRSCHTATDQASMHANPAVVLGCTDCHGGDASVFAPNGAHATAPGHAAAADGHAGDHGDEHGDGGGHSDGGDHGEGHHGGRDYHPDYLAALERAHVLPRYPHTWHWPSSALPERTYTLLNREAPEYVRFVNPGDLRVAEEACGACHGEVIDAVSRSLMATSAMFWGGAAYNNGILPFKRYILGEGYTRDGEPAIIPGLEGDESLEALARGIMSKAFPLPAFETVPPADNFRVFERGGLNIDSIFPEIGLPNPLEEPGKPDIRQSNRGPGTGSRVSIPVLNLHKTRLNDPNLWFMGTADQPGDYRSSGCTGCHVPYANDREPLHSGPLAAHGHWGRTVTADPTIPKDESGHPLRHAFTRAIPTSQCMVCHMHQPNMFLNSYLGYTMWDYEADAPLMWPKEQRYPDQAERHAVLERNPEGAAPRGNWADVNFLSRVWDDVNPEAEMTQFADYHGHGWNFRAIFKRDRKGNLLDADGNIVAHDDPDKFDPDPKKGAVHMRDIHAEKGMHCVDCHYSQDAHGNGHIMGEVAAAVEIRCRDCHGTSDRVATLRTSGPASKGGGRDIAAIRNPDGQRRFVWRDGLLYQRSILWPEREWAVPQVKHTISKGHADYNAKAARAKTMRADPTRQEWGPLPDRAERAHNDDEMACFSCHSSWVTSCAGCHLPIEANRKTERHHYEGGETRNYASYNPQVVRDQTFMLGKHGPVKGHQIVPLRSTSALVVSSTDINRNHIYVQQPTISASGYSSQAINPHFPHTVRRVETKTCTDCHLSADGDNNAIIAQVLGLGTNFINFLGFNAYVGTEKAIEAVQVTEWEEPQAVLGSYLHKYAYPDEYERHQNADRRLSGHESGEPAFRHHSHDANCLQLRGEYLYVAEGKHGMQAYDVANVANKFYSERIITAPFSPLGHDARVESADATCVVLPTTQPVRPERNGAEHAPERAELMQGTNLEQPMHAIYRYAAVTDAEEGLILVDVVTMGDFEPRNNFLDRDVVYNPDGLLDGARYAAFAGHRLYVAADAGIVVVDLDDPKTPRHVATIPIEGATGLFVQFRYLFVTDGDALRVVDITYPHAPRVVEEATVPIPGAHRVFVARTYAYVAARGEGLVIVDVERAEAPVLQQTFKAGGAIADARDVTVASTNGSLFAYVADGSGGLKIVQLTSPELQPRMYGFSPEPRPELIAWHPTKGDALAVSRPLERDRAVDESGNQVAVFGRIGSRPFTADEMRDFYMTDDRRVWTVRD